MDFSILPNLASQVFKRSKTSKENPQSLYKRELYMEKFLFIIPFITKAFISFQRRRRRRRRGRRSMKREGRQHGLVSSKELLRNSRPSAKIINGFGSPPTARFYSKVSSKPTNHSKFTGKCARPRCMECHTLPVCKSRDKAKGSQKLRSCDVATNHRLIAWRIMDKGVGQNYTGVSATGLLSHLSGCYREDMDDGIDDDDHDAGVINHERSTFEDEMVAQSIGVEETVAISEISIGVEGKMAISPSEIEIGGENEIDGGRGGGGDDDYMDFYAVGYVWEILVDDEDWCLVGEM
eukprot:TRINITY_DN25655_c0_g1_i4.p1 TRINITY_DN25655_c0_g1~~TRINITY_DN25655_c0_g1_i4.p1  ORF type:complete len:293 (-),score=53.52 TRINITY_DN25655_c0_g1_i4:31-909(-)